MKSMKNVKTGKLNKFSEQKLLCYIARHGTNDGRVMCGTHGIDTLTCDELPVDQKVLIVVDACRANIWAQSVPSNVSAIGAKFTSYLNSEARIKNDDGPVGSLLQWSLDSAIYQHHIHGGGWTKHLFESWDRIVWKIKAPEKDKQLLLHNIEPWMHVF